MAHIDLIMRDLESAMMNANKALLFNPEDGLAKAVLAEIERQREQAESGEEEAGGGEVGESGAEDGSQGSTETGEPI
jgi:hypothetical protein